MERRTENNSTCSSKFWLDGKILHEQTFDCLDVSASNYVYMAGDYHNGFQPGQIRNFEYTSFGKITLNTVVCQSSGLLVPGK